MLRLRGFIPYLLIVFLNAFIDLGHKIVIQNTLFKVYDGETQVVLTAIVNALILLPFILLFSPSGFLSDKYPKHRVMQASAFAAIIITLGITACYYAGWFWAAFGLTFVLAVQSAFYSPAKYGYIKELVGNQQIAAANGVVQTITIGGILLGTFVFSALFEYFLKGTEINTPSSALPPITAIGWLLVSLAIIEFALSLRLADKSHPHAEQTFVPRRYFCGVYLRENLSIIHRNNTIWLSIIGLSTFWAVSQVVMATFPAFAKLRLEENNTLIIQGILACSGIGIMLGASVAGRISRRHIETGLIPLGAIGISIALALLPNLHASWSMALAFIAIGFSGGILIIPLNALIQYSAKEQELGTVLAGNNWVQNIAMLSFLAITVILASSGVDAQWVLSSLSLVALLGTGYAVYKLPHSLVRTLVTLLLKRRYRIEVMGFERLPVSGAALLLGNHISWIDWALVQIACPRKIHFVMQRQIYNRWYLKPFMKLFGTIPIASGASRGSLKAINEILRQGEVVCLFPEGAISRNGHLGQFLPGYERTVEGVEGVIIPFYLRGLWGSNFSRSNEKLREIRMTGLKRDLIVAFGEALPLSTPCNVLKQKVFELSGTAWDQYTQTLDSLPLAWIKTAKREGGKNFVADSEAAPISYRRLLAATLVFSRCIKRLSKENNIGLILPASSASLITNMAVLINGKTCVNINYTADANAVKSSISSANVKSIYTSRRFVTKLQQRGIAIDTMLDGLEVIYLEDLKDTIPKWRLLMALATTYLPVQCIYWLCVKARKLDDAAAILFSSGSEGTPKGIVLSHRNILANCKQISDVLNVREDDVIVGCLPPFHSFGLTVTTMMPMVEGLPVVCHPDPTDVLNVAKAICRQRATILLGTATFLRLYTRNSRVSPLMLESLRVVIAGAEKLPEPVRTAFQAKFNINILEGYGATETTPVASCNIPDQLDSSYWKVQKGNTPGSVGMPLPGSSVRIVDPDTLGTLPIGEDGLIMIAGTQVMLGYLNNPEKTDEVIVEIDGQRWYKTGDKGHVSDDGFLFIVDRYSRFAKVGGEMISLGAVEQHIKSAISDAEGNEPFEVAAVNIPDDKKGEKVLLLVAGDKGFSDNFDIAKFKQQLIDSGMNSLMLPSTITCIEEIPKLGSGKVDFKGLSKIAKELQQ